MFSWFVGCMSLCSSSSSSFFLHDIHEPYFLPNTSKRFRLKPCWHWWCTDFTQWERSDLCHEWNDESNKSTTVQMLVLEPSCSHSEQVSLTEGATNFLAPTGSAISLRVQSQIVLFLWVSHLLLWLIMVRMAKQPPLSCICWNSTLSWIPLLLNCFRVFFTLISWVLYLPYPKGGNLEEVLTMSIYRSSWK
jgi:hypothetical protein